MKRDTVEKIDENSEKHSKMEVNIEDVQQIDINFENITYTVSVPKQKGE